MIAGGNRPSLTEARAETGGGVMGVGLSIQSNILLKTDFFDSLKDRRWAAIFIGFDTFFDSIPGIRR